MVSCGVSKKTIGVLFDNVTEYPPYYVMMDIPINHTPVCWSGTDIWETLFEFKDGSYIYFLRNGVNPNYTRIKIIGDSLFNQRFGYASYDYFNPMGDSLYSLVYEGVDSGGLYWKDIHYLFPDSLCLIKRRGQIVPSWKSDRFRVTIGYARVSLSSKKRFDEALESFNMVRPLENDSSFQILLNSSFQYNARFRYMTEYEKKINNESPIIDIYSESRCR